NERAVFALRRRRCEAGDAHLSIPCTTFDPSRHPQSPARPCQAGNFCAPPRHLVGKASGATAALMLLGGGLGVGALEEIMSSFRNKVTMSALMVASLGAVADAEQLIVFEAPFDGWRKEVSANFAVNRELGRAWIDVQMESPSQGEEAPNREVISKVVDGLS